MNNSVTVGFIGNPNCGKTTLFNAYTGANLKVANWPGVTVEKKEGHTTYEGQDYTLIDLRAGLSFDDKRYKISAFVRNLGNTYYWTNATRITDTTVRFAGRPRTFGVNLSARF